MYSFPRQIKECHFENNGPTSVWSLQLPLNVGQEPIQKSNTISCMKNSIQIGNERKDRVWNKTMSKEGEFSYTSEAKNLV